VTPPLSGGGPEGGAAGGAGAGVGFGSGEGAGFWSTPGAYASLSLSLPPLLS
jgi:hypothetical protein